MKTYSFYHAETGLFNGMVLSTTDSDAHNEVVALNTPQSHIALEGHYHHEKKRVDVATGEVRAYQPPRPTENHVWDTVDERWVLTEDYATKLAAHNDALARIAQLESIQPRFIREHTLGTNPKALERLQAIEDEIVALRKNVMQELCGKVG